jgi:hypothetical protein
MRFNGMAVSVLAQSVPLLAVGHLAGWKRREERSWLQGRRLRDALLLGDHDKKGMLFKKRVGVHGKHDNDALEKKRSGSTRLVQDSASSEVRSDDREASVECDPLSKMTDSGILGCAMDLHCIESEESEMGGLCVAANLAPSINRALQQDSNFYCDEGTDEDGFTCDCSQFNQSSGVGNFTCSLPSCWGTICMLVSFSSSYNADGSYNIRNCFELNSTIMGLDSYCSFFSISSDFDVTECGFEFNGIAFNSCEYTQEICPYPENPFVFDCTNTITNIQGDSCDDPRAFESFFSKIETFAPSASSDDMPSPGTDPTEPGRPSASPEVMPSPAKSSGGSHAAKVTVVVSAAAAAWVATFGT